MTSRSVATRPCIASKKTTACLCEQHIRSMHAHGSCRPNYIDKPSMMASLPPVPKAPAESSIQYCYIAVGASLQKPCGVKEAHLSKIDRRAVRHQQAE